MRLFHLAFLLSAFSCAVKHDPVRRQYIDLSGNWQFALDSAGIGKDQQWYLSNLNDTITLPGTTDLNRKGFHNTDTTTMHLNRLYIYEGIAWYRKTVTIPRELANQHIILFLERTKTTDVWIDSVLVGGSRLLQSPQLFDVSDHMTPGEHTITIRVNNDRKLTPYGNVHIYSDDTQTNWNGILGKIYLETSPQTHISGLQISPDIGQKKIGIRLEVNNGLGLDSAEIELLVEKTTNSKNSLLKPKKLNISLRQPLALEFALDDACSLWDEYEQPLYTLTVILSAEGVLDTKTVPFGMRKFAVDGTHFAINGRKIFLRGKHEAAVFPITGFPPMVVDTWQRVFRIAKTYGINHYRFHSYCPPEAAFTAADLEGIYLQAELPFWGGLETDSIAEAQREEGYAMLEAYANHPSLVLFSHGNEIWSGHDRVEANIKALKKYDPRPLYTMGCNNNIGYVGPREVSDFFVAARTPYAQDTILTHTRLTHAFADSREGGILNTQPPSTVANFDYAVSQIDIPTISHEIGQYQIYPDYSEIDKYTGVLRAWNLEVFRDRLANAGMADLDSAFQQASGTWSAICYQAEMEAALRTEGLAGFQLLDLQDFPGQGTALVGILDAFMDSKGVITPEEWKRSCDDVVILLEMPKYCWKTSETFQGHVKVANYSNRTMREDLVWQLKDRRNRLIDQGRFTGTGIPNGSLYRVGAISTGLSSVMRPEKLTIRLSIPGTNYTNMYPVWVYPPVSVEKGDEIIVSGNLDDKTIQLLQEGSNVLLFPNSEDVADRSLAGLFPPDFWNYGMFKGISEWVKKPVSPGTLGLLTDPEHPVFRSFPTDFHTNWQWFSIIKASHALVLDATPPSYRPIVQVIDNLERNHKLGLLFEFRVGKGKLLVCMAPLEKLTDRPEATWLYQSILDYMRSGAFQPMQEMTAEELVKLFEG